MSENTPATRSRVGAPDRGDQARTSSGDNPLVTPRGTTVIADSVVTTIAGVAAREISGVHGLGGSAGRAFSSLRQRIPGQGTDHGRGIEVATEDQTAWISVSIVAEYGVAIADLASGIRTNIITSVGRMTGMTVETVDVDVTDVHIPSDDDTQDADSDHDGDAAR